MEVTYLATNFREKLNGHSGYRFLRLKAENQNESGNKFLRTKKNLRTKNNSKDQNNRLEPGFSDTLEANDMRSRSSNGLIRLLLMG
ncbi:hypothetical protein B9Z55_009347 [Caenorhabditis nigoni]|uniref:Uncharacterized protein n=1 Tax=Caenorhabditis nigoni TaxID=1611254 RepID=A0A2G5URL1_9PELO|nr:hypothetical protein B9Z55_009347 [Caenorhabditis nigoni]